MVFVKKNKLLKNAIWGRRRTFWLLNEPLTSDAAVWSTISSDYTKVKNWLFVDPKMILLCIAVKRLLSTFSFKSVGSLGNQNGSPF